MTSLNGIVSAINNEIDMSEQTLTNILARLDEDIARIQQRREEIIREFADRRAALEQIIGVGDQGHAAG